MKKIIDYIAEELSEAFEKAGYDRTYGKVTLSNRPDLCEYQCNGAMAGAKAYKKAPFMIAEDVVALLEDSSGTDQLQVPRPEASHYRPACRTKYGQTKCLSESDGRDG